jgi:type II secretory pathway predicted ATPase ExeA
MYQRFYKLSANPFALSPDPAYLYLGRQHRHAITLLEYALQQGSGFALVSGEIGSGKTTIIHYLLQQVVTGVRVGLVTNTHSAMGALLPWVIQSLGLRSDRVGGADLYDAFVRYLRREHETGHRIVLIIDEAQNLTADALEELRVLSNVNAGSSLLLQTILAGQPELRRTLSSPRMQQFAQRIAIDYHLAPLRREETHEYICHRLGVAGGSAELIDAEARDLVHAGSGGVPRLINQICDTALVYGFSEQRSTVDSELVELVLRDRGSGLLPLCDTSMRAAAAAAVD